MSNPQLKQRQPRKLGRSYLVSQLMRRGMSRRRSVEVLNFLFEQMKQALARGEEVGFPFGKLKVARHQHRTQTGSFLNRKLTTYKQPFTVVHETDANGRRLLRPKQWLVLPPKPGETKGKRILVDPSMFGDLIRLPPKQWLKNGK